MDNLRRRKDPFRKNTLSTCCRNCNCSTTTAAATTSSWTTTNIHLAVKRW